MAVFLGSLFWRAEGANADAGDQFEGTIYESSTRPRIGQRFADALGFDLSEINVEPLRLIPRLLPILLPIDPTWPTLPTVPAAGLLCNSLNLNDNWDCDDSSGEPVITGMNNNPNEYTCANFVSLPQAWTCTDNIAMNLMTITLTPGWVQTATYHIELSQASATVDRCATHPSVLLTASLIRTENDTQTPVANANFNWSFTQDTTNSTVTNNGLITVGRNEVHQQLNLVVSEARSTTNATAVINTAILEVPMTAHTTFTDPQTCEVWRVLVPNQGGNALIITEYVHGYLVTWFDAAADAYNWWGTPYHETGTTFVPFESSTLFMSMQLWYQNSNHVGTVLRSHARNYQLSGNYTTPTTGTPRVFALTGQEATTLFEGSSRRSSIIRNAEIGRGDVTAGWWLRSQSASPTNPAQFVSFEMLDFDVYNPEGIGFNTMQHQGVGFRPALWIQRP